MKKDTYMNWFTLVGFSSATATTLATDAFNTGAGVSTQLAWRIHKIEIFSDHDTSGAANGSKFEVAISTRKSLTAIPQLTDKGCLMRQSWVFNLWGAGTGHSVMTTPITHDYLPPMLVASPSFSIYIQGTTNPAGYQSKLVVARIGFTTERLTESAYREVFETWNYAN